MANAVEYVPKGKSSKQENRFKWTLAALLAVIIILIVLIGILSAYANFGRNTLCTTKECIQSAAALISCMDQTYDPCDDFYKFACNKFEEANLGHAKSMDEYTQFHRITYRLNHIIQKFLQEPVRKVDPAPVQLVKKFYKSCDDKARREELGYAVMDKYLSQAGLPKVPKIFTLPEEKWNTYTFDWVKTAVQMKKVFGIDLFVNIQTNEGIISIIPAVDNPKMPQILTSKVIALYDKWSLHKLLKSNFKLTVVHTISEVLASESEFKGSKRILNKASEAIWNLTMEEHLARKVVGGGEDYEIRGDELRNISFVDLQNLTEAMLKEHHLPALPKEQEWRNYLTVLFKEITGDSMNFTEEDVIYYFEKGLPYIIATPILIAKIPDVMLEMLAWWKAVFLMIASTTEEIGDALSALLYSSSKGSRAIPNCIDITTRNFDSAIKLAVVTEEFLTGTKPAVEEFIETLRESFLERLQIIDWIDDVTRETAIKKLHSIKVLVGAPNWISNETLVMEQWSTLTIRNDSYMDNLMQLMQLSVVEDFENYFLDEDEEQVDSDSYGSVNQVNAFYLWRNNFIIVPWSILNNPAYHLGLPSLNYGALGTVIGHEIIHGFDGVGRRYDDESNFRLWWTEKSLLNFEQKSKCFVQQYQNFSIRIGTTYLKVNATNSLNENMADNGGMRVAYHALQKYLKEKGPEYQLPGLTEFTSEQLFFLSHAHLWCLVEGSAGRQLIRHMGEHAPNDARINGIAQNMPEFSEAFNCPIGSGMNPKRTRCDMW